MQNENAPFAWRWIQKGALKGDGVALQTKLIFLGISRMAEEVLRRRWKGNLVNEVLLWTATSRWSATKMIWFLVFYSYTDFSVKARFEPLFSCNLYGEKRFKIYNFGLYSLDTHIYICYKVQTVCQQNHERYDFWCVSIIRLSIWTHLRQQ